MNIPFSFPLNSPPLPLLTLYHPHPHPPPFPSGKNCRGIISHYLYKYIFCKFDQVWEESKNLESRDRKAEEEKARKGYTSSPAKRARM